VSSFWKRQDDGLEGELRRNRPEARDELVASVAERVRPRRRRSFSGVRLGVAVALTIGMLAAMAPIGAASYAGSAAIGLVSAASHVLGPAAHSSASKGTSPASAQYKVKKLKKKKKPAKKHKSGRAGVRARRGPAFTG
jgi:hypothetical protein